MPVTRQAYMQSPSNTMYAAKRRWAAVLRLSVTVIGYPATAARLSLFGDDIKALA
jgi:hypothetical protein